MGRQHKELSPVLIRWSCSWNHILWKTWRRGKRCSRFAFETCYSVSTIVDRRFDAWEQVFTFSAISLPCLHNNNKETVSVNQQFRKVEKWKGVLCEATWEKLLADFERSELPRQTRQYGNGAGVSIDETIESFKEKEMYPFLAVLIDEISSAMDMDNLEVKAFDVFNTHADVTDFEREEKAIALFEFYGRPKTSHF